MGLCGGGEIAAVSAKEHREERLSECSDVVVISAKEHKEERLSEGVMGLLSVQKSRKKRD